MSDSNAEMAENKNTEKIKVEKIEPVEMDDNVDVISNDPSRSSDNELITSTKFTCEKCNISFSRDDLLQNHLSMVHDGYKCYVCDKIVWSNTNVHQHIKIIKCHRCEKPFNRLKLLYFHIEKDHEGLKCYICEKKFNKKSNLIRHVENIHSSVESHKCENVFDHDCEQAFEMYSDLRKHILRDHIMEENEFYSIFEQHGNVADDILNLNADNNGIDEDEVEEMQVENNRNPDRISEYPENKNSDDNNIITSQYPPPGKNKVDYSQYGHFVAEQHRLQDENSKDESSIDQEKNIFNCSECGKTFTADCNLKRHIKSSHTNSRYNCEKCSKSYTRNYLLNNHLATVH